MTSQDFEALKEFAALFRAEVQTSTELGNRRLKYLFDHFPVCKQALFEVVQTEGPRKAELDAILHQIDPRRYPA